MSKLPQHSAGESESLMGSSVNLEGQLGVTIDEISNNIPDTSERPSNFWTSRRPSTNSEFECKFPPRGPNATIPDAVAYASFGDGDTTASVTAFGQITQITRFLGIGTSGFFSVDQADVPEPWYVEDRARKLMELSGSLDGIDFTFGRSPPKWIHQLFRQKPILEFVRDRWPRFTIDTPDATTTMQFFIHDSTVFGTWTCQPRTGSLPMAESISFRATQLIRELEFLNPQHSFNEASRRTKTAYQVCLVHDEEGILIAHSASPNENEKISCGVGVVIAFYVNGIRQKIEKAERSIWDGQDLYQIRLGQEQREVQYSHPLEITTAYKLQKLRGDSEEDLMSVPPPTYHTFDKILGKSPYARLTFSSDEYVDFIVRRNLEHILSVCCVHVTLEGDDKPMVALTCGDMSGHRITAKGSFFAFQFLISVFKHLGKSELDGADLRSSEVDLSYKDSLRKRILKTCQSHLNWLFGKAENPGYEFAKSYWATGKPMNDPRSGKVLSDESLADTALQILKHLEFVTAMDETSAHNLKNSAKSRLEFVIPYWLQTLDETDKRGFSAFPKLGTQQYRLEDHVWIWKALNSIKNLDLGMYLRPDRSTEEQRIRKKPMNFAEDGFTKFPTPMAPLSGDYRPDQIQRKVLKLFATENTASGQQMIAVSRTATETRFMFHSTDSVLLCDSNAQFFEMASPLWKATMECQKFYRENEESCWDNPLYFATALIMSSRGYQITVTSATKMLEYSRRFLLRISSPNGLFAGKLDPVTKEPQIFQAKSERDLYWNVSFEIPVILWEYGCRASMPTQPYSAVAPPDPYHINPQVDDSYQAKETFQIEKSFSSSMVIDQKDTVELEDEWLYSYPDFLDFDPYIRRQFEDSISLSQCNIETGGLMSRAITQFMMRQNDEQLTVFKNDHPKGIVVDVAKTMRKDKCGKSRKTWIFPSDKVSSDKFQVYNNEQLFDKMDGLRTAQRAKKRLIWLPKADEDTALICFLASPESEKMAVSSFFDRHDRREDFLSETVAAASNIWTTEFHLSWYQIHDQCRASDCEDISFLSAEKTIGRAAVGFLFTGDFFDRYWTCRVLEHRPKTKEELESEQGLGDYFQNKWMMAQLSSRFNDLIEPTGLLSPADVEKYLWRQRRVLELLLFDLMLRQASTRYEEMLEEIIKHLIRLLSPGQSDSLRPSSTSDVWNVFLSSHMSNHTYTSFSKDWPRIQCILQILEDDLKKILSTIILWKAREKDREPEKPRWTRNDENKYRSTIRKLLISNNEKVRELEEHMANIRSLSTYLTILVESTRNVLSFKSSENVRFFTLVTSIFLPLGFSTAVFSMNGVPGGSELTGWAILAAVCVCVTFTALYFKGLEEHVFKPAHGRMKAAISRDGVEKSRNFDGELRNGDDNADQRSQSNSTGLFFRDQRILKKAKKWMEDLEGGVKGSNVPYHLQRNDSADMDWQCKSQSRWELKFRRLQFLYINLREAIIAQSFSNWHRDQRPKSEYH